MDANPLDNFLECLWKFATADELKRSAESATGLRQSTRDEARRALRTRLADLDGTRLSEVLSEVLGRVNSEGLRRWTAYVLEKGITPKQLAIGRLVAHYTENEGDEEGGDEEGDDEEGDDEEGDDEEDDEEGNDKERGGDEDGGDQGDGDAGTRLYDFLDRFSLPDLAAFLSSRGNGAAGDRAARVRRLCSLMLLDLASFVAIFQDIEDDDACEFLAVTKTSSTKRRAQDLREGATRWWGAARRGLGVAEIEARFNDARGSEAAVPARPTRQKTPDGPSSAATTVVVRPTDHESPETPHDYQRAAIAALTNKLTKAGDGGMLALPTGSGKTKTAIEWILSLFDKRKVNKVLWIAGRDELVGQARDTFNKHGARVVHRSAFSISEYSGRGEKSLNGDIVVATLQSLSGGEIGRSDIAADLICIDEAHHVPAPTWRATLKRLRHEHSILLGLSATPTRTNPEERPTLWKFFPQQIVFTRTYAQLLADGYLAKPVHHVVSLDGTIDVKKYEKRIEQFHEIPKDLYSELGTNAARTEAIVRHLVRYREDYSPMLLFACSIEHARDLNDRLGQEGFRTALVVGETPKSERKKSVEALRRSELDCIVNVEVLTEGADFPKLKSVIMARPTMSDTLYSQMFGRGSRGPKLKGTEEFYVVDFVDNFSKFGDRLASGFALEEEMGIAVDVLRGPPGDLQPIPAQAAARSGPRATVPAHVLSAIEAAKQAFRAVAWELGDADVLALAPTSWIAWAERAGTAIVDHAIVVFDRDERAFGAALTELGALKKGRGDAFITAAMAIYDHHLSQSTIYASRWEALARHVHGGGGVPAPRPFAPPALNVDAIRRELKGLEGLELVARLYSTWQTQFQVQFSTFPAFTDALERGGWRAATSSRGK